MDRPKKTSSVKAALEASLERYLNLVKHLPVGVYRTLPDGTFIEANPALAKMLGLRRPSELFRYNVKDWDPKVNRTAQVLSITQLEQTKITGIPTKEVINEWKLKVNDNIPVQLQVNAGAYKGTLDLSGLRLQHLEITDGASQSKVFFNTPNREKMDLLSYKTGASSVELTGLANANFKAMTFDGGAGSFTLDFSGSLMQPADVSVKTGVSNLVIVQDGDCILIVDRGKESDVKRIVELLGQQGLEQHL